MTVATINALLYVDRRPDPELLERALGFPPSARAGRPRCARCSSSTAAARKAAGTRA